jgi:hypothetical protein
MDIHASAESAFSAEGYTLVSSYCFMHEVRTTVSVPESPPAFEKPTAQEFPLQIASHTGFHSIDEHAKRAPNHEYEPVFQAVAVMSPDTRSIDVGIVIDRITMLTLIKFESVFHSKSFILIYKKTEISWQF